MYVVTRRTTDNECAATHSTCLWVHVHAPTSMKDNQCTGTLSIKATQHPHYGTRFDEKNFKTTMQSAGWCMLLSEEPQALDILPPIAHILWVHEQGPTSLGHTQYTNIIFIQTLEQPSCGTRFDENCKTTNPSPWLSMLWNEEPHVLDVLSSIPRVL